MAWYGKVAGGIATGLGTAQDYLTPGKGSGTLTDVGRAMYSDESTLSYPGAINPFARGSAFKYSPQPGAQNQGGNAAAMNQSAAPNTMQQANPLQAGAAGGGGGGGQDYSSQLAQLQAQEQMLRQFLDSDAGVAQQQGLSQLQNEANRTKGDLNFQRGRAIEDFNTKTDQTLTAKNSAVGRVGENARNLRRGVMDTIGRASGSGSSAFQQTAPNAIDRDASLQRTDVLDDFSSNFTALNTAKKRAGEDYDKEIGGVDRQLGERTGSFLRDIEGQKQAAYNSMGDIARQRAAYQGGNPMAAGAPFDAQANQRKQAINDLFNKYNTAYNVAPVQVQNPSLRDYVVDRTAINAGNAAGTPADATSPYSQFLKQEDDEKDKLF